MNWQVSTPTQVASLYQQGSVTGSPAAFTVAANSSTTIFSNLNVSNYESYDIAAYIGDPTQNNVGHALACKIELKWFNDNVSGIPVYIEDWQPWVSKVIPPVSAFEGIVGTGPMHGQFMTVTITNGSSSAIEFAWLSIFGSPRNQNFSDWRQNITLATVQDATLHTAQGLTGTSFDDVVFEGSFALAANQNYLMPINLYAGNVSMSLGSSAALAGVYIVDIGTNYANFTSGNVPTAPALGHIWEGVEGAGTQQAEFILPRSACAFVVKAGTAATNFDVTMIAQGNP